MNCIYILIQMQQPNSPYKYSSSKGGKAQQLPSDLLQSSFPNKYINDGSNRSIPMSNSFAPELQKQKIYSEVQSINSMLVNFTNQRLEIGDLFSASIRDAEKTLETIRVLIFIRQKDLENKNQLYSLNKKYQLQKNQLTEKIQKSLKDNKKLDAERDSLNSRIKLLEKTQKENLEKLNFQKEQISKKYKAIEARENQYRNEIRKQEGNIKTLQEKINKGQEKVPFKNSFEIIQNFQAYQPTIMMLNAEKEYNQVIASTMEQNFYEISKENQFLKDSLQNIYRQLNSVLEIKKEVLKRRRGYDGDYDNSFELKNFKSEILNLPNNYNRDGLTMLNENVMKFREAMKLGQANDQRDSDQKVNCVTNVKNLIRNYKSVVESQDQLLNKVILKAKQFKNAEMQSLENKYSKSLEEDQIERAKKFLEEQSIYLESKNKQLEVTRKAMQNTIKKAEEEKIQFQKRTNIMNEEILKVKKQVQILPSIIEQQLQSL